MNTKDIILKLTLDEKLAEWGASFSGYSCVEGKTTEYLAKYKYAVTIGIRLLNSVVNEITDVPSYTYFKHYRLIMKTCLREIAEVVVRVLMHVQLWQ